MKHKLIYTAMIMTLITTSCKKGFLEKKPDKAFLVPTTLADFQAILDNSNEVFNHTLLLSELATDDISLTDDGFTYAAPVEQNTYTWAKDLYQGQSQSDWNKPYQQIFYANIVIDGLNSNTSLASNNQTYNQIKGTALFARAFALYNLTQQFTVPYQKATANQQLGLPLRLTSDVQAKSVRSTLQQTYDQINADLQSAVNLLPSQTDYKTRPMKATAYALLAKTALTMENYPQAETYATQSLASENRLLDFNNLNPAMDYPIPAALSNNNPEVLYYAVQNYSYTFSGSTLTGVEPALYNSYANNDLRPGIYFKPTNGIFNFKGSYTGTYEVFGGIATDEVYLILAESQARNGKTTLAMQTLNLLLTKRFKTGQFQNLTASTPEEALSIILKERRKELVFRNIRWSDLRRLNLDPRFQKTITHTVNNTNYTLTPNSNKYTFPIPNDVIANSGITQNER